MASKRLLGVALGVVFASSAQAQMTDILEGAKTVKSFSVEQTLFPDEYARVVGRNLTEDKATSIQTCIARSVAEFKSPSDVFYSTTGGYGPTRFVVRAKNMGEVRATYVTVSDTKDVTITTKQRGYFSTRFAMRDLRTVSIQPAAQWDPYNLASEKAGMVVEALRRHCWAVRL